MKFASIVAFFGSTAITSGTAAQANADAADLVKPPPLPKSVTEEGMGAEVPFFLTQDGNVTANCTTLEQINELYPDSVSNDTMAEYILQQCQQGVVSTAEEIAAEVEQLENSTYPSVEEQIASTAEEICSYDFSKMGDDIGVPQAIIDACTAEPRDDERVVEAAVWMELQNREDLAPDLDETCWSLEFYHAEIEEALLTLAASSKRHLETSGDDTVVTSLQIAVDSLEMYNCLCDESNPDNHGCLAKMLRFLEISMRAIEDQVDTDFANENPASVLSKVKSSLDKSTQHLRHSGTMPGNDVDFSMARDLSDAEFRGCDPPGVQATPTGYSLCLYAGPVFGCEFSWDRWAATCITGECGGGNLVQMKAALDVCPSGSSVKIGLELKLCINVISDVINVMGKYIPGFEKSMNALNIYGGCYRLARAEYDANYQRMSVDVPTHGYSPFFGIKAGASGQSRLRFKNNACHYKDNLNWYYLDWRARNNKQSWNFIDFLYRLIEWSRDINGCRFNVGNYAQFKIDFKLQILTPYVRGLFDWGLEWKTVMGKSFERIQKF